MDINFDKLAIVIIDEFESDRECSGRDEIVKGMKYVLNKYTSGPVSYTHLYVPYERVR